MFAYCRNNPVCRRDIKGRADEEVFDEDTGDVDVTPDIEGGASVASPAGQISPGGVGSASSASSQQSNASSSITQQLQQCATSANSKVSGKGPVVGTSKHSLFAQAVNALKNSLLKTEVSYKNGNIVPYGTKGSIRFDVVLYDIYGNPVEAWDFKTGNATLNSGRINAMQGGSGLEIPITLVK